MASRNRLINGPVGESEVKMPKPYRSILYHLNGSEKMFTDREEHDAAIVSGDWVDSPAKIPQPMSAVAGWDPCPFWYAGQCEHERKKKLAAKVEEPDEPEITVEEMSKKILKSPLPSERVVKYMSMMNATELKVEGAKYGLDFTDNKTTKKEMIRLIKRAKDDNNSKNVGNGQPD